MANAYRGEIAIKVDGVDYVIRPTFDLIAKIENEVGPILFMSAKVRTAAFKLVDIARLIQVAVSQCENKPKDPARFLERLVEIGLIAQVDNASAILAALLGTGDDDEKKDEAGSSA